MADTLLDHDGNDALVRSPARVVVHDITRRAPIRARQPARSAPVTPVAAISPNERAVVVEVIDDMRRLFEAEGGDIQLVDIRGGIVRVRLGGACIDCGAAPLSLGGVQQRLRLALGRRVAVVLVATADESRP